MSSPSLPALLESPPYGNERETCRSYESETSREHVSCFSTALAAGNHHHNVAVSSNFLPHRYPDMPVDQFLPSAPQLGGNPVSAFPSLRSLQENLQFRFLFPGVAPAAAPPATVGDSGQWQASEQKVVGNRQQLSELDCFWSY